MRVQAWRGDKERSVHGVTRGRGGAAFSSLPLHRDSVVRLPSTNLRQGGLDGEVKAVPARLNVVDRDVGIIAESRAHLRRRQNIISFAPCGQRGGPSGAVVSLGGWWDRRGGGGGEPAHRRGARAQHVQCALPRRLGAGCFARHREGRERAGRKKCESAGKVRGTPRMRSRPMWCASRREERECRASASGARARAPRATGPPSGTTSYQW